MWMTAIWNGVSIEIRKDGVVKKKKRKKSYCSMSSRVAYIVAVLGKASTREVMAVQVRG